MTGFILSGHVVDFILVVLLGEILLQAAWSRGRAGAVRLTAPLVAALPGACLLLALRAALTDAGWIWIALWLAASFPAHLADLWRRPVR